MADYELSILRNTEPVDSKNEAIAILDSFDNHMIGQPISILYHDDESNNELKLLFAVGKKNAYDTPVGEEPFGKDFYDIIGETDGKIFWLTVQGNVRVDTDHQLSVLYSDSTEDFELVMDGIDPYTISFVNNRIYRGNNLISSLRLDDLSLYESIEINNVNYSGSIEDIIRTINEQLGVTWNGTQDKVKFEKTTDLSFRQITPDENTIYKVDNNIYIGGDLIGDNYNTNILDTNIEVPNTVGGIKAGTTLNDLLNKGSVSAILDELLFPTVNPTITQPSINISLNNYSNIQERGAIAPTPDNFSIITNKGNVTTGSKGYNYEYSGEFNTDSIAYNVDNNDITFVETLNNPIYIYNVTGVFANGDNQPITNKGDNYSTKYNSSVVTSNDIIISTYHPYYNGTILVSTANTPDDITSSMIQGMKKTISSVPTVIKNTSTGETERMVWAIPEGDELLKFKNISGEESLGGYTIKTLELDTLVGKVNYNIYIRNTAISIKDFEVSAFK